MRRMILLLCLLAATQAVATSTDLEITVPDGTLGGTLLTPEGDGPWPVVLVLAGSGPVDRDGNLTAIGGKNNAYLQLAEGLATRGVASLRVDKRGVGASATAARREDEHRFGHLVDDAVAWCDLLKRDDRFSSITTAGHSQGSLVGMAAAWRADADGFVSLAGPGRPLFDLLEEQLTGQLAVRHRVKAKAIMDELAVGRTVEDPPPSMTMLFRPSLQEFLISWQRFDPQQRLARLSCPVAIVQGLKDLQVKEVDARRLHEAYPEAELLLLEKVGHLMKVIEEDSPLAHQIAMANPDIPIDTQTVDAVARVAARADAYHEAREAALDRLEKANRFDERTVPGQGLPHIAEELRASAQGYLFGLASEGYAKEGEIIPAAGRHDCVSFMYRSLELARADSHRESLSWALRTRFAGVHPAEVVDEKGRVDYDRPEHLDFSLDMIRSGIWGRDVTAEVGPAVADPVGTDRYPAESFVWLPEDALVVGNLQAGDIIWFVLDPEDKKARKMREEHQLVIGHIGVLGDGGKMIHAASKALPGLYDQAGVQTVDLKTYLERVERYGGIMVTRP